MQTKKVNYKVKERNDAAKGRTDAPYERNYEVNKGNSAPVEKSNAF
mgnify:CR=1 FL=1